ncbi:MAG: sigma 54-interacting transcriptional regulator, partial [Proteobacteria bacterium]|nr:sigma 54-interacting transcriptional regulator [Pseudomonadota bacterium]MBU1710858.1 sigma 54-interacting transcriptional regulator [Pseudomonadota bacterium]
MMEKRKDEQSQVSRKRLAELRVRLEQVATAWTVDNYESLVEFFVLILPRIMGAERCTIFIIEMGTDKIYSKYGTGLKGKQIEPPRKGSIAGQVIETGKPEINNQLNKRTGYHKQVDAGTGFVTKNSVCVPIKSLTGHGVTGAVQVLNRLSGDFNDDDAALLSEVASYLSMSIENIIVNQEILRVSGQINREVERFDKGYFLDSRFIAESPVMLKVLELVRVVCASPVNVLLQGENGTGKELIARMIHNGSNRRENSFVAVNCAAIPENLMESEFFGYEKGAFTGADHRKKGLFEAAEGGTLFLDEIADMPIAMQPKFLRAIQEKEGARLGSTKTMKYDFRVISATNKKLQNEVAEGRFREDLFFRLFSVEIVVPPLRERKDDLLALALFFVEDTAKRFDKSVGSLTSEVSVLFEKYSWPGNIRQLQREIERLVALTPEGKPITVERCSDEVKGASPQLQSEKETSGT